MHLMPHMTHHISLTVVRLVHTLCSETSRDFRYCNNIKLQSKFLNSHSQVLYIFHCRASDAIYSLVRSGGSHFDKLWYSLAFSSIGLVSPSIYWALCHAMCDTYTGDARSLYLRRWQGNGRYFYICNHTGFYLEYPKMQLSSNRRSGKISSRR